MRDCLVRAEYIHEICRNLLSPVYQGCYFHSDTSFLHFQPFVNHHQSSRLQGKMIMLTIPIDISPLNQAMRTQIRRLRTTLGLDVESPCNIEHKSRLACQTLHLLAAIRNVYARHQATGMRSLGCAAVDDADGLLTRAKSLRVLGQADKAQNFFGDGGTDGLVLQEFAEYMHAGIVFAALVCRKPSR